MKPTPSKKPNKGPVEIIYSSTNKTVSICIGNEDAGKVELMVFDLKGNLVLQTEFSVETKFSVDHFEKGTYLLTIKTYSHYISKRLFI